MITGPTTPTAGPDTASIMYRLTDSLRVEVHRPEDDDGEWVDAITAGVEPNGPAHRLEIKLIVDQLYREKALWVHALDQAGGSFPGGVFGWRSETSPTGWWSGTIERVDHSGLRALVSNILPGEIRPARMVNPHTFRPRPPLH